jgi:hypothetical protein
VIPEEVAAFAANGITATEPTVFAGPNVKM